MALDQHHQQPFAGIQLFQLLSRPLMPFINTDFVQIQVPPVFKFPCRRHQQISRQDFRLPIGNNIFLSPDNDHNQKARGQRQFTQLFMCHPAAFIHMDFDKGNIAVLLIIVKCLLDIRTLVNHPQLSGNPREQRPL